MARSHAWVTRRVLSVEDRTAGASVVIMPETGRRLALMRAFAQSYRDRHFEDDHYDLDEGYLQTTLSDDRRMPLRFFVDYNNAWWFEIVTAVDVPAVGYDADSDSGFIVLDIRYDTETLRAMQHVHFSDHTVNRIRTYASGTFFAGSHPLVELDRFGNCIWLETGYHLRESTVAACTFLDSARGKEFAAHEPTAVPVARIRRNLGALLARI